MTMSDRERRRELVKLGARLNLTRGALKSARTQLNSATTDDLVDAEPLLYGQAWEAIALLNHLDSRLRVLLADVADKLAVLDADLGSVLS